MGFVGFLLVAAMFAGCSTGPSKQYTITGEYISVEPDPAFVAPEPEPADDADDESSSDDQESIATEGDAEQADEEPTMDLSMAKVVVTQEITNDDGESEAKEIASGSFSDGHFALNGEIKEPTEVEFSVDIGEDDPLTTKAMLGPGAEVSFVLIEYQDARSPRLSLYGESRRAMDPGKKFSISGDLNAIDADLTTTVISISGPTWDEEGKESYETLGSVMLRDGKFSIEADVDEPVVVGINLNAGSTYYSGQAVVEAKTEFTVSPYGASTTFLVTSGTGLHAELIESWQSADYLEAMEAYSLASAAYRAEMDAAREAAQSGENDEANDASDAEEAVETSTDESDAEEATILALADGIPQVEECEHVDLSDVKPGIMDGPAIEPSPARKELDDRWETMSKIRDSALEGIAESTTDPFVALIALELGAFGYFSDNRDQAIRIYDQLAPKLDEDIVARRLTPERERLVAAIEIEDNDKGLVPGQKAPEFTLPDLSGVDVALYDVVADRDLVLVDFWASWCGPCIATFPHLKKFYSAFNDDGFEIVAISIDSTHEAWAEASEEHELPWMNLGEIVESNGEIANAYGVQFIPKGYLLDTKGCVIQKDLQYENLQEVLVARYGDDPLLHESEDGAESSPTDSDSDDDVGGEKSI